ncbi:MULTISPECIES: CvfD/Ygs/GSP13 family RNA-binding post-transcriptional regulator [Lactobacillales]|jgi:general stress protein 13|uniref:CvfD/Ygs/GSP13 family RNA-binding post-transcriptional regulator n=1 Tax=Aerococcus urinaeequi TaxID=51665 RepID=A0A0U4PAQ9_9LACT|nr:MULTISPECIES: CvfD/Ygs/GSP13 family RNA-binding post-transcriptional regulator [Lactobacillales]KAF3302640.1 S1 RNA-binding domain-containing protein [Carnobacterium sp. PL17RED31]ALZ88065.1 general stress protein [Aerococcus urinaeequi]KAF3299460.1 S1 RNA-binding domain-containing protein [Carnobacterium sp. PL12RED10]KAF3304879.1 S1 RNA-binding domain-containing protein [Carnobacterium sp. PL17GRE32]MBA5747328.1 S1 RNA-binding domain-containing protein [Aerococcus urinaeequi]
MTTKEFPYHIGDVVEGEVTGLQPYGVFVQLDEDHQGLIHISEINHGYVSNVEDKFTIGQKLTVKIIDIDEFTSKMSLSIRALKKLATSNKPAKNAWPKKRPAPKIGFVSIEEQLPGWVEEALQKMATK